MYSHVSWYDMYKNVRMLRNRNTCPHQVHCRVKQWVLPFFCVSVLCMGCIGTDQLERHLSQINLCTRWSPKHLWSLHFQYYYTSPLPNLSFSVDITTSSSSSRFPTINIIRCLNGHWDNI